MSSLPNVILLLSGKRKSGKDFLAELLTKTLSHACIIRLSAPLKEAYAMENNLDFQQLLSADTYKELYRKDMVAWGEKKRSLDPGYFCRLAIKSGFGYRVWIVADCRRKSDLEFFENAYANSNVRICKVRIVASETTRIHRGWSYTVGIDDQDTECALDSDVEWSFLICNDQDKKDDFENDVQKLVSFVSTYL